MSSSSSAQDDDARPDASDVQDLPTTAWKRSALLDALAPAAASVHAPTPTPTSTPVAEQPLQHTLALPRSALFPAAPAFAPVAPAENAPMTQIGTGTEIIPRSALQLPVRVAAEPAPSHTEPVGMRAVPVVPQTFVPDASTFVTTSEPIADIRAALVAHQATLAAVPVPLPVPAPAARPAVQRTWSELRARLGLAERRQLIAFGLLMLVVAVAAVLGVQTVLAWRAGHAAPIAHGSVARSAAPAAKPAALPVVCHQSTGPNDALSAAEAADPLVHEAVQHVVRGRRVEAGSAYAALAARYPTECAFAVLAKVLKPKGDSR